MPVSVDTTMLTTGSTFKVFEEVEPARVLVVWMPDSLDRIFWADSQQDRQSGNSDDMMMVSEISRVEHRVYIVEW